MWDLVNKVVGWDYLTPQGIKIGIASFIALIVVAPARSLFNAILIAIAALLVAQVISHG